MKLQIITPEVKIYFLFVKFVAECAAIPNGKLYQLCNEFSSKSISLLLWLMVIGNDAFLLILTLMLFHHWYYCLERFLNSLSFSIPLVIARVIKNIGIYHIINMESSCV